MIRNISIVVFLVFCFSEKATSQDDSWSISYGYSNVRGRPFYLTKRSPSSIQWCSDINVSGEFYLTKITQWENSSVQCEYTRSAGGAPYGAVQVGALKRDIPSSCPSGTIYSSEASTCVSDRNPNKKCAGNPIDVLTGTKIQSEKIVDIAVPGGTLTLKKIYQSILPSYEREELNNWSGAVHNWFFTFTDRVESFKYTHITGSVETEKFYLRWKKPNGIVKTFFGESPDDMSSSDSSVIGAVPLVSGSHLNGWKITDEQGDDYVFNNKGYLSAYTKNSLYTIDFNENSYNRDAYINGNHIFTIVRGFSDETTKIKLKDGATFSYQYDSSKRLIKETFPDASFRSYHYQDPNYPMLLTGITDEKGVAYATWEYDVDARAILSSHAGNTELVSIDYTYSQDPLDPRVTVTNAMGKNTTYHYKNIAGLPSIVHVEGHQSLNCEASDSHKTYYENGRIQTSTDWEGNVTYYEYDDANRIKLVESGYKWISSPLSGVVGDVSSQLVVPLHLTEVMQKKYCWNELSGTLNKLIDHDKVVTYSYTNNRLHSSKVEKKDSINDACI